MNFLWKKRTHILDEEKMKLPVVCPHCETEYQLDSGLQGKKIRCLNSLCQEIFLVEGSKKPEVKKDLPKQKPPEKVTSAPPKASSVEQILPFVSAQQADSPENSPADSPSEAYTQPPPPVRGARVQESEPKAESPPPKKEKPEQDTSYDQPPPVRTNVENSSVSSPEQGTEAPSEEAPPEEVTEDGPEDLDAWLMSAEESSPIKKEESLSETLPGKPPDPPPVRSATATEEEGSSEDWQAPPVRTSITDGEMSAKRDYPPEEFAVQKSSGAGTRNLLIILALLILAGGGVGLGIWMVQGGKADAEQKRWLAAKEKYDQRSFEEAAAMFHQLNLDFPDSPKGDLYHFLSGLSEVRGKVEVVHNELDLLFIALDQFGTFLKTQQGVPFMEEYQGDIWTSLQHAIEQLTFRAEEKRDRDLMKKAKALVKKAAQYDPPPQKLAVVRARLKDVEEVIVFAEEKKKLETQLKNLIEHPEGNVPKIKDEIVSPYLDTHPKLAMEPEIRQLLAKIPEAHRKAVTFQAHNDPPLPLKKSGHITNIFVQDSKRENSLSLMDHQVALAQARGVLYGMDPHNGKLLWAYRVGLDNEAPPLRIPATPIWNERLLVLSSDRYTVSALEAESGREIWKQQLTSPCLGRPVLLKDRIFLALYEGKVDEIEINGGRRLGSYRMGQNLTGWGVREPSSYRLYFPAQENCLFVLDVAEQKCVHILYTKHPMGSMDGQPVLLEGKKKLLLLKQTKGLDKTHLRIFPLPMPAEEMPPIAMLGWLWFTPYVEDDRLSFVSDAGEFFAFGIGQTGSRDDPLFPLFRRKILRGRRQSIPRPRGQVFHADANKFWLMVHGNIQQVSHGFFRQSGPKLLSSRFEPVFIGNPTQNGRTQRTESGEPLFFLVTQKDENHLALLVGPKSGRTLWQTKLGLVCNKPPITVGTKKLIIEQDGRQFLLDTKKELPNKSSWVSGQEVIS